MSWEGQRLARWPSPWLAQVENRLEEAGNGVGVVQGRDVGDVHVGANDHDGSVAGVTANVEDVFIGKGAVDLVPAGKDCS